MEAKWDDVRLIIDPLDRRLVWPKVFAVLGSGCALRVSNSFGTCPVEPAAHRVVLHRPTLRTAARAESWLAPAGSCGGEVVAELLACPIPNC